MYLNINIHPIGTFGDSTNKTVKVNQYDNVRKMKWLIYDEYGVQDIISGTKFYLIYKNIILNEEKLVSFYKIVSKNEVKIGLLENILNNNEVIVEVFLGDQFPSIVYLIAKCDDKFSQIKSIVEELSWKHSMMFDQKGIQIDENKMINEVQMDGAYYRIIVNFDMRSVGVERQTFENCLGHRNQYIIRKFMKLFPCISWRIDNNENWRDNLLREIEGFKNSITDSNEIKYNDNFVSMPDSFINSQFLFCIDMAERVNELWAADYDRNIIKSLPYGIRDYIFAVLHVALINLINSNTLKSIDQSIKSVIIVALDIFLDYLRNPPHDWIYLMKLFLDRILASDFNVDRIKETFESNSTEFSLFNVKVQGQCHSVDISDNLTNIRHIKKAVSKIIREPINRLYFIHLKRQEQPKDDENIEKDQIINCLIEILFSIDNEEEFEIIGEGGHGSVYKFRDKIRNKIFAIKVPHRDESLYNEIASQCFLEKSHFLKIYLELVLYNQLVCMAMECLLNGNLINYVENSNQLHHNQIARLSYEILLQINNIHTEEIIHGDINGFNIILNESGVPSLIDFDHAIRPNIFTKDKLTKYVQKNSIGTLGYTAPELRNNECSTKIDIWSFGIVVAEMVMGKRVTYKLPTMKHYNKKLNIKLKIPLNENLLEFYQNCSAVKPDDRWTARKLLKSTFIRKFKLERLCAN